MSAAALGASPLDSRAPAGPAFGVVTDRVVLQGVVVPDRQPGRLPVEPALVFGDRGLGAEVHEQRLTLLGSTPTSSRVHWLFTYRVRRPVWGWAITTGCSTAVHLAVSGR